jgi:replicative DNA helicase
MVQRLRGVYYTFELAEKVVANRFYSMLSGVPYRELEKYRTKVIKQVEERMRGMGGSLIIKEFPTKGASIRDIERHIEMLWQKEGYKVDYVVIDYADIMIPADRSAFQQQKHDQLQTIYEECRRLAQRMNLYVWTASQANREAYAAEVVGVQSVAESLGKVKTADLVISITKKTRDRIYLSVQKNRRGPIEIGCDVMIDPATFRFLRKLDD